MSSSLSGLTTIRAFGVESQFEHQFYAIQDRHTSAYYLSLSTARWFSLVLDWVVNFYITAMIVCFFTLPSGTCSLSE
jgi:ABC-type multidrug transport system fused ATPase/permease subunit